MPFQNNNITEISIDTFCKGNNTYYLRPSLNEVRLDGNPVVLSKYPNSFICLRSLPIGRYYWAPFSLQLCSWGTTEN